MTSAALPVSVVVCTRDRPQGAARVVQSILESDYAPFELVVVDQSASSETAVALDPFAGDTRFHLVSAPGKGISVARNLGVRGTTRELVLFTDDDCAAEPDWIAGLVEAFATNDRVAIAFGSVNAAGYDRNAGLIASYNAPPLHYVAGVKNKAKIEGIGASMAVRRSAWLALGGFDEAMGINGTFCSAEETDFMIRALVAGYAGAETDRARVTHYGFRSWDEAGGLISGYMRGLGAAHAKMLRLAGSSAVKPVFDLGWRWLAGRPVVDLNHRPPRGPRLGAFLTGFASAMRMNLDARGKFVLS